ncbi:MAG: endonuclease/exonuclease/phosphatase family protein [Planctomycetota bacterium]
MSLRLRLLTWNIHKGIGGLDRRYAPGRIVGVLQHYAADVVLLQEVDQGVPRSGLDRQAELLADRAGYPHVAFGSNVCLKSGCYGNATLSRFPILRQRNINLSFPMKKGRGALFTAVDLHGPTGRDALHVVNLHLGLSGVERRWQIWRMLRSATFAALDPGSRLIIGGDFNDWTGTLADGALKQAGLRCLTGRNLRTFPSWGPVGALDRIFLRGGLEAERHYVSRLDLARAASDHLPVVVELTLSAR